MKMDHGRMQKIVSAYLDRTFSYNTIIDADEDCCITIHGEEDYTERTISEFVGEAKKLIHPLFKGRFETELSMDNLRRIYAENRTIRVETLMLGYYDREYHWYRVRIMPVDDGSGHVVFFANALLVDDDIRKTEETRKEMFNKAVIDRLLYNYILVYVIDLSNGMSKLVYSTEGDNYDLYAKSFDSHLDMMNDVYENYLSEDFKVQFKKFMNYEKVKKTLDADKDRMVLIFRDKNGTAFEMVMAKYPDYEEDYPLVIFSLKELS